MNGYRFKGGNPKDKANWERSARPVVPDAGPVGNGLGRCAGNQGRTAARRGPMGTGLEREAGSQIARGRGVLQHAGHRIASWPGRMQRPSRAPRRCPVTLPAETPLCSRRTHQAIGQSIPRRSAVRKTSQGLRRLGSSPLERVERLQNGLV